MRRYWASFLGIAFLLSSSCSSRSPREILEEKQNGSRARAASYAAEGFYDDNNFKPKPVSKDSDFFFKHCNLVGRHPFPSVSDWECTEAQ